MATHAELAARLLRECARFFRAIEPQQGGLDHDLGSLAETCEVVAELVEKSPSDELTVESFGDDVATG